MVALMAVSTPMFLMLRGCGPQTRITEPAPEEKAKYLEYLASRGQSPKEFILASFARHDVVYLGDSFTQNTSLIVRNLIPDLYKKGVRIIGIEFALADDQEAIDALLTGDKYDAGQAHDIVSKQFVSIVYQEMLNLFSDVWKFNHELKAAGPPLRLVGLGVNINLDYLTKEEFRNNKEMQRKALGNMTLDEGYFKVIDDQIIQKKEKALLYLSAYNCYKNVKMKTFADYYSNIGLAFKGTVAMMTKAVLKERQLTILFHNELVLYERQAELFPMHGVFEALFRELPPEQRVTAFPVPQSPFASLPVAEELQAADDQPVLFKDMCDAYILNGSVSDYRFTLLRDDAIGIKQMERIYHAMGVDPAKAKAKTPEKFISMMNEQIMKANTQLERLPR
jgi:hypothetical protein